MRKLDQFGKIESLFIPLVLSVVVLLATIIFSITTYLQKSDLSNNIDTKVSERLGVETQRIESEQQVIFLEKEKEPLKPYSGPTELGSVEFKYPKIWSGYVNEASNSNLPLDATFHPNVVPASDTAYALRVQIVNNQYSTEVKKFDSKAENGTVKVSAYKTENVDGVPAVKITGQIDSKTRGTLILIQVRDKTLKMWTESDQFTNDFETRVLPSLTFSP
ncbi:MAG: hypothetical protein M3P98_03715 [bacterium]|nr:hypothetical protein [bacterium]